MGHCNPIRALSHLLVLAVLACAGCSGSQSDLPRTRQGELPFPGSLTLYTKIDAQNLGPHRYEREARFPQRDESETGILYTTQAGFLDLAHLRITIDWTRYCANHIREAMAEGRTDLQLMGSNGAVFDLTLHYPDDWDQLSPDDREQLANELALRGGERVAYLMVSWHELVQWFGYETVPLISEKRSSFTWDDVMSHVIGVLIADRALRDRDRPFDDAVTSALNDELKSIGAVSKEQTAAANRMVEGLWWADGRPLKRQLDIGLADGVVHPWLVRGLAFTPDADPRAFQLPTMKDIHGHDMSGFCSVEIDPRIGVSDEMRRLLPSHPPRFSADHDLPMLIEIARAQMREESAPDFDQPWPPVITASASHK